MENGIVGSTFHSMASLHARMAAFVELVLWQQPVPSSTSATFAMPLLVEPLSTRLRTSGVRCRCACRMDGPTFSDGANNTVRTSRCTMIFERAFFWPSECINSGI